MFISYLCPIQSRNESGMKTLTFINEVSEKWQDGNRLDKLNEASKSIDLLCFVLLITSLSCYWKPIVDVVDKFSCIEILCDLFGEKKPHMILWWIIIIIALLLNWWWHLNSHRSGNFELWLLYIYMNMWNVYEQKLNYHQLQLNKRTKKNINKKNRSKIVSWTSNAPISEHNKSN